MNNTIPAVEKTLALLELLATSENGLTQAECKKRLAISMSTCYRILQTLLSREWIRKDENGIYYPGKGLFFLYHSLPELSYLPQQLQILLDETAKKHEISCKISMRQNQEQFTVMRSEVSGNETTPAFFHKRDRRFPLIEGSVGAVLLSRETKENILFLAENSSTEIQEKLCPQLIFDRIDFLHKNGYSFNENNRWNICAVSAPIREKNGRNFAALTFILPRMNMDEKTQKKYIALLKETSKKCENIINNKGE